MKGKCCFKGAAEERICLHGSGLQATDSCQSDDYIKTGNGKTPKIKLSIVYVHHYFLVTEGFYGH